ncbi:MAG: DUF378 domain-containing protein [Desulfobacteraceae bacterium]|nr:MAG: DUF378 domain-containing protein [Desulfobacteraceae bacterium]
MKIVDMIAATFLFIGGINWGLVGLFGFDLIASIFGSMSILSRIIYFFVAICAIYDAVMWNSIKKRWECRGEFFGRAESPAV